MKTFHKALLVALVAIFSFGYASADFRFGIKAGMNFSKLDMKIKDMEGAQNSLKDGSNRTGLYKAGNDHGFRRKPLYKCVG